MTTRRVGRAVLTALAGLLLALLGLAVLGSLAIVAGAAMASLVTGPGDWAHGLLYAVALMVIPLLLLWTSQGLAEAQRARVRTTHGAEIPLPGAGFLWWPWRSAATWRGLSYHLAALVTWPAGGWDARVARALLGPSRRDELTRQVASLSRSRAEILAATDAERRRIERDLHDGAQQRLVSLAMNLGMARATLTGVPEPARRAIAGAHDEALLALEEMRAFIRGLHPAVLNDRGLDAALSGLVAHAPIPVRLTVDVPARTPPTVEAVAYFIVSEALANVAKHADATRAEVTVAREGDLLHIAVVDDGRGGAAPTGEGTGLRGLAQRAASVDGTLTVDSPVGGPTTVRAELPCGS